MVRIANTILQFTQLEDILAAITRELANVIRFDRSSIAFMTPDGKALTLQHIYKSGDAKSAIGDGRRIPLDENSIIGWVAVNGEPVLRPSIVEDGRFLEIVKEERLACDMVVPLVARGKVIGTINVGCYEEGALSERDLGMLINCGSLACGVIEHALLLKEAKLLGSRYHTLQRNASDIILLVDRDTGALIEVNRKTCDVLGYAEEELLGRSFFELFPSENQLQARRDFVNILSRKSTSFVDRQMRSRDGGVIYVDISASLVDLEAASFVQILVHDISQRRMLEQQIIRQNRRLQDALRKLREVDRMKTEFLANISHELRTPLSVIIAYADTLREPSLGDEERRGFLDVVAQNGQSLLRLINDLLDLSQLETTEAMLSVGPSHLHDVVRAMWAEVERQAKDKGIELRFEPGADVPVAWFDSRRMQQVVSSLVHNALKFTPEGGKVVVRSSRVPDGVCMEVADTGAGIPAEHLPSVFVAFRQIDGSTTRRWGGLGIGLAMAKHIVELHGGRIWVESRQGEGSTFRFVIPADAHEPLPVLEIEPA
ncbi:MAG: ATP-binding protein [Candidatus Krumholzibacteria bacterium]|nr:ATP-binding protein [Candidatus Krumholzibacteria bacterium]